MTTDALPADTRTLALELHGLLGQIDPARWRPDVEERVRQRLGDVRVGLSRLADGFDPRGRFSGLRDILMDAVRILSEHVPVAGLSGRDARVAWRQFRQALTHAYEQLVKSLEAWDVHVPSLRPTNYARNVFHVFGASMAAAVLSAFPYQGVLVSIIGAITAWAWTTEFLRRRSPWLNAKIMAVFAPVAHPHEWHRVNSATWYATALLVLALLDIPTASLVALLVLGIGDPMAAIVGRRFGRIKLVHGRSLEGTSAFVVSGAALALAALTITHPQLPVHAAAAAAVAGAFAGSIAELFSRRIDDNFSIPLSAATAATVALHLLGFSA